MQQRLFTSNIVTTQGKMITSLVKGKLITEFRHFAVQQSYVLTRASKSRQFPKYAQQRKLHVLVVCLLTTTWMFHPTFGSGKDKVCLSVLDKQRHDRSTALVQLKNHDTWSERYLFFRFKENLIVFAESNKKQYRCYIVKTMNPLSTFGPLPSNIDHPSKHAQTQK